MSQKRTKTHPRGAPREDFARGSPLPAAQDDSDADSDAGGWMRLAFITDVHADVHALHDALRQIERLGCDLVVCAGDLIDWGLFPEETLSVLRDRRIPCIRGNHDRWAVEKGQDQSGSDLTRGSLRFLEALPMHWAKVMGGARIVVWHARPGSDTNGVDPGADRADVDAMLDKADADVLVVGHTHVPLCISGAGGRILVNPGALLRDPAQPMEAGGTFGVLELPARRFTVHRAADGEEVQLARGTTAR